MLRIGNISEVMQTRTLRVLYGNTQAYPFAANIDPTVYDITGASAAAFAVGGGSVPGTSGNGPIWPGQVAALAKNNETVCVAVGGTAGTAGVYGLVPLGLFANFVGGDFDESNYAGGYTEVGVWKGPGSWYQVLTPVWNTNITSSNATGLGTSRYLWWDANGLLSAANPGSAGVLSPVALLGAYSTSKIEVMLYI